MASGPAFAHSVHGPLRVRLAVASRDDDGLGRVTELRLERADVLVDQAVVDDVSIHLGQRRVSVADPAQRDHELQEICVGLLPERFLRASEEVVQQRSDGVRHGVRIEVVVQRVVAEAGVEPDLEVVVCAACVRQDAAHLLAEVALHLQNQAADLCAPDPGVASAAAGRRTGTCRPTSSRCRRRRESSRRCRARAPESSATSGLGARPGVALEMRLAEDQSWRWTRLRRRIRRQRAQSLGGSRRYTAIVSRDRPSVATKNGVLNQRAAYAYERPTNTAGCLSAIRARNASSRGTGYAVSPHTPTAAATHIAASPRISTRPRTITHSSSAHGGHWTRGAIARSACTTGAVGEPASTGLRPLLR